MTEHEKIIMHKEARRISDKEMLCAVLDLSRYCVVALHDEPYPYVVPMNFGYVWEEKLVVYFHMAIEGHRIELIKKNPNVSINVCSFLDRRGFAPFRKENHDYRSVSIFGKAEIILPDNEEEFLKGMSALNVHNDRPPATEMIPIFKNRLFVLKVTADIVTGKAQYPISTLEEVAMPENVPAPAAE